MATFKIGDKVVLGKHLPLPGIGTNWASDMDAYVGKTAILAHFHGKYPEGNIWGVEGNPYSWREANMTLVSAETKLVSTIGVSPTVAINDHVCPTCGNNRCSRSEKTCWKCGNLLHS